MGNCWNLDSLSISLNLEQLSMDFNILKNFDTEGILVATSGIFLSEFWNSSC